MLQVGDPSVPKDLSSSMNMFAKFLRYFYDISDTKYKNSLEKLKNPNKYFDNDYLNKMDLKYLIILHLS